jgi:hypothetical protein
MGIVFLAQAIGARDGCGEQGCNDHNVIGLYRVSEDTMIVMSKNCCAEPQQTPCDLEKGESSNIHAFALPCSRTITHDHSGVIRAAFNISIVNPSLDGFDPRAQIGLQAQKLPIYLKNLSLIC